jgi:hypothetical protein
MAFAALSGFAGASRADAIGSLHCNDSLDVPLRKGQPVTITGVVVGQFSTSRNSRLYVEDATGAINVFGAPPNCAPIGDSLRVSGVLDAFGGLTEITGADPKPLTIEVLSHHARVPAPLRLTPKQVRETQQAGGCEPNESRLIEVDSVFVRTWDGNPLPDTARYEMDTNYRLVPAGGDSTSWAIVRLTQASGCDSISSFDGRPIPTKVPVRVIGVLSQHVSRTSTRGGYQILPRDIEDIKPMSAIRKP